MNSTKADIGVGKRETSLWGLEALLEEVRGTLPELTGFRSLSLFGSLAQGSADGYSDMDLVVVTSDLSRASAELTGLLERLGPVEFCWAIRPPCLEELSATIVLSEEGYYHHLDISLVDSTVSAPTLQVEQTVLAKGTDQRSGIQVRPSAAYAPAHGSLGHFILDMLLGGVRYLKAREREQTMLCYRFAAAASQWCARTFYTCISGIPFTKAKLSTEQYLALDRLVTDDQRAAFLKYLDFSSPAAMDRAMYSLLSLLAEHTHILAARAGENMASDVIHRFLLFIKKEIISGS